MPTGHRKWKCLVTQIRPAEEVALTSLPGYSDAQTYYKARKGRTGPDRNSRVFCDEKGLVEITDPDQKS